MRKYRIIKETNLNSGEEMYLIQERFWLFFWCEIRRSLSFYEMHRRFIELTYPQPKPKFKREEVVIDNIYV